MNQEQIEANMSLIIYGGDAKSFAFEAIQLAKEGKIEEAFQKLSFGSESLQKAHHAQTDLLTKEACGQDLSFSLLTVHAQDHVMTAIAFLELAREFVELYQRLDKE